MTMASAETPGRNFGLKNKTNKSPSATVVKVSGLKSFRQWKNERIQESLAKFSSARSLMDGRKIALASTQQTLPNTKTEAIVSRDISLVKLENQLRLDLMSLEMAKDLTVTDYFVGYVNKIHGKKESINEIAGKMSTDEVAELMSAYAQSIFGASSTEIPKSATNQGAQDSNK